MLGGPRAGGVSCEAQPCFTGKCPDEELGIHKAIVPAFLAERGPIPRSVNCPSLDGRVTLDHVDQGLKSLLQEGRIRATQARLAKSVMAHGGGQDRVVTPRPSTRWPLGSEIQGYDPGSTGRRHRARRREPVSAGPTPTPREIGAATSWAATCPGVRG
jgi:hypothetical protein